MLPTAFCTAAPPLRRPRAQPDMALRRSQAQLMGAVAESLHAEEDDVRQQLRDVFDALTQQRLLELCPPCTLPRLKSPVRRSCTSSLHSASDTCASTAMTKSRPRDCPHLTEPSRWAEIAPAAARAAVQNRTNNARRSTAARSKGAAERTERQATRRSRRGLRRWRTGTIGRRAFPAPRCRRRSASPLQQTDMAVQTGPAQQPRGDAFLRARMQVAFTAAAYNVFLA